MKDFILTILFKYRPDLYERWCKDRERALMVHEHKMARDDYEREQGENSCGKAMNESH